MLPSFALVVLSVLKMSARLLGAKQRLNKERLQLAEIYEGRALLAIYNF